MSIVRNEPCPMCQEMGHDARGNHLLVFEDGGKYCSHKHWHKNGEVFYLAADGTNPILDMEIDGTIKYTIDQFKELEKTGKLSTSTLRAIALSGMRGQDRWTVSTDKERELLLEEKNRDRDYFELLKVRNLVDRHIKGEVAKAYNVRVGLGPDGKTARHYYPVYDRETGEWRGAKCRTLPKDFKYDHLGWLWGDVMLFGQHILTDACNTGSRMDTLLLVGGECDAMAAFQMLLESKAGTKYAGQFPHVWSPTKGEKALSEILANKEAIDRFKRIIVCFDNDDVGNELNKQVSRIFRGKTMKLVIPAGCKDPNDCLKKGKSPEFVDAWWNPVDPFEGGVLSPISKYRESAKRTPEMGLSWPWPDLDNVTYGIRPYWLGVLGAGTGVGKTTITKQIVFHLAYNHKVPVVVIYLEEQPSKVVRSLAGRLINKELTAPPCNDKENEEYLEMRDYTEEQANAAIDALCDDGLIMVGDLEGRKDVESVMEVLEEAVASGYKHFIIDNLTAFEHKGEGGKSANKVDAIDETMRRLGTFKDEHDVWLLLLSHLKKPFGERTPHEEGGEVSINDFRGAGSITFWSNAAFGAERNTKAESMDEKCLMCIRNVKNRDIGYKTGTKVWTRLDTNTGDLIQCGAPAPPKRFDDGTKPKKQNKEPDKEF